MTVTPKGFMEIGNLAENHKSLADHAAEGEKSTRPLQNACRANGLGQNGPSCE